MKISSIIVSIVLLFFGNGFTCFEASQIYFADGYNGSSYIGSDSEIVNYFSKEDNEIKIEGALPKYSNEGVNYNTCANVAGTIILGYFDKDNNDLIPNFQASRLIRDKLIYTAQTEAVQNVIDCLYTKMSTNVGGVGTTIENFKAGLQSYVLEKNSDIQYLSLMDEEGINVNLYKNSIDDEKPSVFLFRIIRCFLYKGLLKQTGKINI